MFDTLRAHRRRPAWRWLTFGLLALVLAFAPSAGRAASPVAPQAFPTADAAVTAFAAAMQAADAKALRAILGTEGEKLVASGDPVADANGRARFTENYAASHALTMVNDSRALLTIGPNAWPMPIPLVRTAAGWQFDAASATTEIVNRRIGRNELRTIRTLLALVQAQHDYADRQKAGPGPAAFARRFLSSKGKHDGLYWDVAGDEAPSPLDPLITQAEEDGYPGASGSNGAQTPYNGYLFRLLTAQGPSAPGGAKAYVRNGRMSEGFAYLAWPAEYANSGLVSFLVDQDGVVFQKDLGPDTARLAARIKAFDPDITWARVDIGD